MHELRHDAPSGPTSVESSWPTRLKGHGVLAVFVLFALIKAVFRGGTWGSPDFNMTSFLSIMFPAAVGWIVGVIALELSMARGESARAVRVAFVAASVTFLVNFGLILFVFWKLRIF